MTKCKYCGNEIDPGSEKTVMIGKKEEISCRSCYFELFVKE